jgi:hypothetical protein
MSLRTNPMPMAKTRLSRARATLKTLPALKLTEEARELIAEHRRVQTMHQVWLSGPPKRGREPGRAEWTEAQNAYRARCAAISNVLAVERGGMARKRGESA